MASRSSQRKSGTSSSRERVVQLLQDGAVLQEPCETVLKTAQSMEEAGLIKARAREYVLCVDSEDRDFTRTNRHCRGRIYLTTGLDEAGHEYRCPECERVVFPFRHRKRQHRELHVRVLPEGVKSYAVEQLAGYDAAVKAVADGVYRVDVGSMGVVVCIVDYCTEKRFLGRDWAKNQATCYIVVNPRGFHERFLDEDWLARVSLADVVAGEVDLVALLQRLSTAGPPQRVLDASVPVYSKGAPPIVVEPVAQSHEGRRFLVEVGPKTVRVEGQVVVAPQADTSYLAFQVLWEQFLDDLREGIAPDQFHALNVKALTNEIARRAGRDIEDIATVRRAINRLQEGIEKTIKQELGMPIDREDVIQTCRWEGQRDENYGYRLNPATVTVRPFFG